MHIIRGTWAALALASVIPTLAAAQQTVQPTADRSAYESRRRELTKELQGTQDRLGEVRNARVQLQARIENVIAMMAAQRARELLMSSEQTALQQLDAILTSSQDALLAQRDRFRDLADAVRRRTGSVLVVVLRADSSQAQSLAAAELQVDGAVAGARSYTIAANNALQLGAIDQLYRSDVLPTRHSVRLQVTVNGQPLAQSLDVNTESETVTYVQFAVRNGQLVPTTWTSRGTTPF